MHLACTYQCYSQGRGDMGQGRERKFCADFTVLSSYFRLKYFGIWQRSTLTKKQVQRATFWMPRNLMVGVLPWTGWLAHFSSISIYVQFFLPWNWCLYIVTLVHRWNIGEFVFINYRFIFSQFSVKFIFYLKEELHSKIIRYVDIMLTMFFALILGVLYFENSVK